MKVSFIGAGNVAWHLSQALEEAGHWISEVYSRHPQHAKKLAALLYDTNIQTDLNFAESEADIIVIAVPDDALEQVIQEVVFPENVTVVNTSGTKSLESLQKLIDVYSDVNVYTGIFYPLQSFSKNVEMEYSEIPFCIESNDPKVTQKLVKLAESISDHVTTMSSEQRFILHISAVFANNFTNYLLSISHNLLTGEGVDFQILKPLVQNTIDKAFQINNPADGQTGPARRGDWETTDKHMEFLQEINPEWMDLYRMITEQIAHYHGSK